MTDRPDESSKAFADLTGSIHAAQQVYDSTVLEFGFGRQGPLLDIKAHGNVSVNWAADRQDPETQLPTLWFNTPSKSLVELEAGGTTSFQIDTPLGHVPHGPTHHLYFLDQQGKLQSESTAVGKLFDGAGNELGWHGVKEDLRHEVLWVDDKGVAHEHGLANRNWIMSEKPLDIGKPEHK